MQKSIITLAYKQVIDANYQSVFGQQVWKSSYQEYLLKSQAYNTDGRFTTFTALKAHDGRANSLHYKSGFAVDGFVSTLNKKIPGLQTNLLQPVTFSSYGFEIIETDITNIEAHKVAITYYTPQLLLQSIVGNYLVLSACSNEKTVADTAETTVIAIQPPLSIHSWQQL